MKIILASKSKGRINTLKNLGLEFIIASSDITNQKDVKRFFEEISNTHLYHIKRYESIKNNENTFGPIAQSGRFNFL